MRSCFVAVLFALSGCESPTAPDDRAQLEQARALWAAQGGPSYSFELNRGCFCVLAGRRMQVTVENGTVLAAEYVDSKDAVESQLLVYLPTVPDLFDLIEAALDGGAAALSVSYDPLYGYPTRVEIDYSAATADDEISFTVRGLALSSAFIRKP